MGEFDRIERKVPQKNLCPASGLHQCMPISSKLEAGIGSRLCSPSSGTRGRKFRCERFEISRARLLVSIRPCSLIVS